MNSLIVYLLEDCEEDQYLFERKLASLSNNPFKLIAFNTIADMEKGVQALVPDIVVTDLNLPECRGFETLIRVKKLTPNSPIIVLTGTNDEDAVKAIQLGAQDYLIKSELKSAQIKRTLLFAKERFSMLQTLEELASRDQLTKLNNKEAFNNKLSEQFEQYHRYNTSFAIAFIDLDNFKQINDEHGHLVGDKLLKLVADRINVFNRVSDFSARIGGDEFAIISTHIAKPEELTSLIEFKKSKFCDSYAVESPAGEVLEIAITMSVGGAIVGLHGDNNESLIQYADQAMYQDKTRQKSVLT